jgi:hypothetical protein
MQFITIDGREYDSDKLSEAARQQVMNIQAVDQELSRLQMRIAICQTARATYAAALQSALPKDQ